MSSTRPIHPAYRPSFPPVIGNVEYSTFAYLTVPRPAWAQSNIKPNLVTACGSTLTIFNVQSKSDSGLELQIVTRCSLAGNVVSLHTLPATAKSLAHDELMIGFAGHPRISIVHLEIMPRYLLSASSIMDLSSVVIKESLGATHPLEQDLQATVKTPPIYQSTTTTTSTASHDHGTSMTGAVIVGGGVSVVVFDILRGEPAALYNDSQLPKLAEEQQLQVEEKLLYSCEKDVEFTAKQLWCYTSETPYVLPLRLLSNQFYPSSPMSATDDDKKSKNPKDANIATGTLDLNNKSDLKVSTGWGEIFQVVFLEGYTTPTLAILHGYRVAPGRMAGGSIQAAVTTGDSNTGVSASSTVGATQAGTIATTAKSRNWHLAITAVSVSVDQHRSVVLWHCPILPVDSTQIVPMGRGVLCISPNVLCYITSRGQLRAALAVNGFAHVSCPLEVLQVLQPNPSPLPRLSIQLDGCRLHVMDAHRALVVLSNGRVYGLQSHSGCTVDGVEREGGLLAMTPLEYRVCHGVKSLAALPLVHFCHPVEEEETLGPCSNQVSKTTTNNTILSTVESVFDATGKKIVKEESKEHSENETSTKDSKLPFEYGAGYLFVGSNLGGDAQLLAYGFKTLSLDYPDAEQERERQLNMLSLRAGASTTTKIQQMVRLGSKRTLDEMEDSVPQNESPDFVSEDELEAEEAELYAGFTPDMTRMLTSVSSVVPYPLISGAGRKCLPNLTSYAFQVTDQLFALGPLGVGCTGTAYTEPSEQAVYASLNSSSLLSPNLSLAASGPGETAIIPFHDYSIPIVPYGHGESGGIALLQSGFGAGLSCATNTIRQEVDLANISGAFSLAKTGVIVLAQRPPSIGAIVFETVRKSDDAIILEEVDLTDWTNDNEDAIQLWRRQILAAFEVANFMVLVVQHNEINTLVVFEKKGSMCQFVKSNVLTKEYGLLLSVSYREVPTQHQSILACVWQEGHGTVVTISDKLEISEMSFSSNEEASNEDDFIVAMDCFMASDSIFNQGITDLDVKTLLTNSSLKKESPMFEDDDEMLLYRGYMEDENDLAEGGEDAVEEIIACQERSLISAFIAVCRSSGLMQIYRSTDPSRSIWQTQGLGSGAHVLSPIGPKLNTMTDNDESEDENHLVDEICFFELGNSSQEKKSTQLFLSMITEKGDLHLYETVTSASHTKLKRISLDGMSTRPSTEDNRHRLKLYRRGMLSKEDKLDFENKRLNFRYNCLFPFDNIGGRCGLFAATAKPIWVLESRGLPHCIPHRMRHVAAGTPKPIKAWCSIGKNDAFLTVHERIGRVGSQRLSVFSGSSNFFSGVTHFPGGGFGITKIPFDVSVRKIIFLDDVALSSLAHPLFVFIVSRELYDDQSNLNDDGLTLEERKRIKDEREAEKTRRQVEADLGGFDMEQEWVEEIEREDYFEIKIQLGGAPPTPKEMYEIWLVDGNGWKVLNRHECEEYEHALTFTLTKLTEVVENITGGDNPEEEIDLRTSTTFVAVGTGYVDKDGEDVGSKGKVLLFRVETSTDPNDSSASLSLEYDKDILLGPVNSLCTLTADGRSRLVIGAGAEVAIEQWGGGKLTQVGFFHAHMYVLELKIFKNFFLLSDAYDSLYFLVWRESDKSLTLLAKDYEPNTIYCSGLLSRGSSLAFVCHDERQNIKIYQYAPKDDASRGGNKLVDRADFHLGTQTISMDTHWCRSSLISTSATPISSTTAVRQQDPSMRPNDENNRFALHFGTIDGGFACLIPVAEPVYWRLAALRSVMSNALECHCALSTRAWRLYRRSARRGSCVENERKKGVIDGELVLQYLDLPLSQQDELASAIGSSTDLIIDNLLDLESSSIP